MLPEWPAFPLSPRCGFNVKQLPVCVSEIAAQPDECYNRVLQMTLPWMNSQSYLGGSVIGQESSLYTDIGRQTVVAKDKILAHQERRKLLKFLGWWHKNVGFAYDKNRP